MKIFRKFAKLTARIIPSKQLRVAYKDVMSYFDFRKDIEITHQNYEKVVEKIKAKNGKIKVVFLIRENQKWTYQSVYEEFEKSEKFEPLVLVSLLEIARKGKDKTRNNLEENYNFFKSKGMKVDYACRNGEYVDLKEFEPDIVFYDQEWDLPQIHHPQYVSEFALTYYCSYGYELLEKREAYTQDFHRFLYKFFVEHEENTKRYEAYHVNNSKNCLVTGYPKLDSYVQPSHTDCNIWKEPDKFKVIYAPHHSLESNGIRLATFVQNGRFILELAKKHPETTWVFRPHPRFKYAILRNKIMNEEEVEEYYSEWEKIGCVYDNGDCLDLMKSSDLMITDCCSFLAEYLTTLKPLIRLVNKKSIKLNAIGSKIVETYYSVYNNDELETAFCQLCSDKNDTKKYLRASVLNEIVPEGKTAAEKIYKYAEAELLN